MLPDRRQWLHASASPSPLFSPVPNQLFMHVASSWSLLYRSSAVTPTASPAFKSQNIVRNKVTLL
ncbi:hypothetical protein E2562_035501 [Oryza meyeriana var. granulata]|uniref:Uncharacterized protein n=1 Tax=Oryza meyeriana var. granulata TaxID=110450 RepID=A0A6G1ESV7_9ORYZ|nr:hypothetical protein E2562_035501 [Oryza meyeriana var. granulata]